MNEKDKTALIKQLDQLIFKAVPKSTTVDKYGGVLYTLNPDQKEGQFCGVFAEKATVRLIFSQGALLDDSAQPLSGSGKLRRHLDFSEPADIKKGVLTKMLKEAASLSK